MKHFKIVIIGIMLISLQVCCKKDNPIIPDEPLKPGRRDYIWTVDTIRIPIGDLFYPWRIWGSAPNDVWLVGSGSPSTNLLWHFDGVGWKKDSAQKIITPSALWGTASNNIWLGNSNNTFWKYNGAQWYKFSDVTPPSGFDRVAVEDIWGIQANDLWGVGGADQYNGGTEYKGIIMHFDGGQWQFKTIPTTRVGFTGIRQELSTGFYFLDGYRYEPTGDTSKVFIYDGNGTLRQIYSNPYYMGIAEICGKIYFLSKQKIYRYREGSLYLWKDFSSTEYFGRMVGRSELDFFGQGKGNNIVHYNGTDMVILYNNTTNIWLSLLVDDSVFFVCYDIDSEITSIIRGTLTP